MSIEDINNQITQAFKQGNNPAICALLYNKIAENLNQLYHEKIEPSFSSLLPRLQDEIAKHEASIESIEKKIERIEVENKELEDKCEKEKTLEEQKQALLVKSEDLKNRWSVIGDLKRKKEELDKPENQFGKLDDAIKELNLNNDEMVNEQLTILDRVNEILCNNTTDIDNGLKDAINKAKCNLSLINEQSKEALNILDITPLESCSKVLNDKLENMIKKYNDHVKKINAIKEELESVEKNYSDIVELYEQQYLTDKEIFGKVEERGKVQAYIDKHAKEIEDFLNQFETMLKDLIDRRESLPMPEIYEKQYDKDSEEKKE